MSELALRDVAGRWAGKEEGVCEAAATTLLPDLPPTTSPQAFSFHRNCAGLRKPSSRLSTLGPGRLCCANSAPVAIDGFEVMCIRSNQAAFFSPPSDCRLSSLNLMKDTLRELS